MQLWELVEMQIFEHGFEILLIFDSVKTKQRKITQSTQNTK